MTPIPFDQTKMADWIANFVRAFPVVTGLLQPKSTLETLH